MDTIINTDANVMLSINDGDDGEDEGLQVHYPLVVDGKQVSWGWQHSQTIDCDQVVSALRQAGLIPQEPELADGLRTAAGPR